MGVFAHERFCWKKEMKILQMNIARTMKEFAVKWRILLRWTILLWLRWKICCDERFCYGLWRILSFLWTCWSFCWWSILLWMKLWSLEPWEPHKSLADGVWAIVGLVDGSLMEPFLLLGMMKHLLMGRLSMKQAKRFWWSLC